MSILQLCVASISVQRFVLPPVLFFGGIILLLFAFGSLLYIALTKYDAYQIRKQKEQEQADERVMRTAMFNLWSMAKDLWFDIRQMTGEEREHSPITDWVSSMHQDEHLVPKENMPYFIELRSLVKGLKHVETLLEEARLREADILYYKEWLQNVQARFGVKEWLQNVQALWVYDSMRSLLQQDLVDLRQGHAENDQRFCLARINSSHKQFPGMLAILEAMLDDGQIDAKKLHPYVVELSHYLVRMTKSFEIGAENKGESTCPNLNALLASTSQVPIFEVYHAKSMMAMFDASLSESAWHQNPENAFTHVADVQAELDMIFPLINHDDKSWMENQEVIWQGEGAPRSTSVGDVLRLKGTERVWLVSYETLKEFSLADFLL